MTDTGFQIKQAKQLIGAKIVRMIECKGNPASFTLDSWGFQVVTPKGKTLDVWVDQDDEGNGPGVLKIEAA